MATATVTVSGGVRAEATFARSVVASIGPGVSVGRVNWNTSSATRSKVNWLPPASVPFLNSDGRTVSRPWYLFFQELADTRMGGVNGLPLPVVVSTVQQTQATVVDTTAVLAETIAYTRGIDATATALKQVATDSGLSGAGTVPDTPEPPQPPGTQVR